jgi:hypothetical protein
MVSASRPELATLLDDLRRMFGDRLSSVVAYGRPAQTPVATLVLVESMAIEDLEACARRAKQWHRDGADTPLLLTRDEFERSIDAFDIEYSEIRDTAVVVYGRDPFAGPDRVRYEDLRRAVEVQVRSHLLHLRERFMDCEGRPRAVAALAAESAPGFAVLLRLLAQLDGIRASTSGELTTFAASRTGLDARVLDSLLALADPAQASTVDGARIFPDYLAALTRLARVVDTGQEQHATAAAPELLPAVAPGAEGRRDRAPQTGHPHTDAS